MQLALTPAPVLFERYAKHLYKRHEAHPLARAPRAPDRARSLDGRGRRAPRRSGCAVPSAVLRGSARHRLASRDLRADRLRAARGQLGEPLVERGTAIRHGLLGLYRQAGSARRGQPAAAHFTAVYTHPRSSRRLWQLPSIDFAAVPFARTSLPRVPASPGICATRVAARPARCATPWAPSRFMQRMRRQNTAGPRRSRSGEVELSGRHGRRGSRPRAMLCDRARPQGRCRRGRRQPRPAGARVHAARLSRIPPAGSIRWPSMHQRT